MSLAIPSPNTLPVGFVKICKKENKLYIFIMEYRTALKICTWRMVRTANDSLAVPLLKVARQLPCHQYQWRHPCSPPSEYPTLFSIPAPLNPSKYPLPSTSQSQGIRMAFWRSPYTLSSECLTHPIFHSPPLNPSKYPHPILT